MNADHIFVVKSDPNAKDAALVKKTESEWTSSKEWKNLDAVKTTKYLMIQMKSLGTQLADINHH